MVKRIQVLVFFLFLALSGVYSIELKHIISFKPGDVKLSIAFGNIQWVSNTEIISTEESETHTMDITSRKSTELFTSADRVVAKIIYKNDNIVLFRNLNSDKNGGQEYYIYSLKLKKMYPLDIKGKEQYVIDKGQNFDSYELIIEKKGWDSFLSCSKFFFPGMTSTKLWKENAGEIFHTELIGGFHVVEHFSDNWLIEMRERLYLIDFNDYGVRKSFKIQNNLGKSGAFLKDGRVLATYCPTDENPLNLSGDISYLKLAIFSNDGVLEDIIEKEIYVQHESEKISISPDGTKLLIIGFDKEQYSRWDVVLHIYEIIYD